jgi:uncharacterized protein YaiE (UPF0345 family)
VAALLVHRAEYLILQATVGVMAQQEYQVATGQSLEEAAVLLQMMVAVATAAKEG